MSNTNTLSAFHGFSPIIYNNLPDVIEADKQRKSSTYFDNFLEEAADLILSMGLEKHIGIFLLHRHFRVEPDHVMLENYYSKGKAFVTRPWAKRDTAKMDLAPSRWIISASHGTEQLIPLEYSTDSHVIESDKAVRSHYSALVRTLFLLLKKYDLLQLFGIGVPSRSSLETAPEFIFLEKNYANGSRSVVTPEKEELATQNQAIPTIWAFKRITNFCSQPLRCETRYRCESRSYCEARFRCEARYTCVSGYCQRDGDDHLKTPHAPVPSGHDRELSYHDRVSRGHDRVSSGHDLVPNGPHRHDD